ncbi:cytochrome b/b6 domain-containing protein [Pollutibacter soli]|uniref:cytochrome b/b6 domain-containing protein n=1 Tax=Pollutibacter soli TaxID=3034157 RepID=UPI0030140BA4
MEAVQPQLPKRHSRWVRVTHWIITISFFLLTFTGFMILMVHPRLYWGEVGNDLTPAIFELPISRNYKHGGWTSSTAFFNNENSPVTAGRTYDIFNQNGWARSLHFLSAWFLVLTGLVYFIFGFTSGHFRKNLFPGKDSFSVSSIKTDVKSHISLQFPKPSGGPTYGSLQKLTYNLVVFFLLPLTIMTGFTMSPAITAAFPFLLKIFFGAQSARTIHFFSSVSLVLFVLLHLTMVGMTGFKKHIKAMTIGS